MDKNKKEQKSKKYLLPLIFGLIVGAGGIAAGIALSCINKPNKPADDQIVSITFDANGGGTVIGSGVSKAEVGTTFGNVIKPEINANSGVIFIGWFLDRECKKPIIDSTKIEKAITIYAGYDIDTTLTIEFNKGTYYTGVNITGNAKIGVKSIGKKWNEINKPTATLSGQTFKFWTTIDGSSSGEIKNDFEIKSSIVVYPFFTTEDTYAKITFDGNGGQITGVDAFDVPTTTEFYTMSKPTAYKRGKDFNYWAYDSAGKNIVKDTDTFKEATTVYAIYKDVNIENKYYFNNETNGENYWLINPTDTTGELVFESALGDEIHFQRHEFDAHLIIGKNIETIDINFLYDCQNFTNGGYDLELPSNLVSIGDSFMGWCVKFNKNINFKACSNLTSIGSSFMQYCVSFDSEIQWPTTTTIPELVIGSFFLENCFNFNKQIIIPKNLLIIPHSFLSNCAKYNNNETQLQIPDTVEKIESYFLSGCYDAENNTGFNQPLTIPKSVKVISEDFLYACGKFNSSLTFESGSTIKSIPSGFMTTCLSFNKTLVLPDTVEEIGDFFLYQCSSFNNGTTGTSFHIPTGLKKIGTHFLADCMDFAKNITLPNTITETDAIGVYFMNNCFDMGGHSINVYCSTSVFATSVDSFSMGNSDVSSFKTGINIYCNNQEDVDTMNDKFAYSGSLPYRKLNVSVRT